MLPVLIIVAALSAGQSSGADSNAAPQAPTAPAPDRWLLMQALQGTWPGWLLDERRISISGWTDFSYTASSAENDNLPLGFNHRANEFLLQQNWVRIDRPVIQTGTEPSYGFRSDWILPGADYKFTRALGLLDGQTARHGFDPIQFYGEAYFPTIAKGMDVKFGHFVSQICVEVNDAPSNALFSHAYGFIYDPFTHTGLLTTTRLTDAWSVQAGIVLGSDIFIHAGDEPTFLGSVKWARPDGRDSVQLSVIAGSGRYNQHENVNNPEVLDFIYSHQFNSRLSYNVDMMFGYQDHVPEIGNAYWYEMVHYLTYNFTPRLSGTARLELFDDDQGQRTGSKGLYTALTAGVAFKPWKWATIRPELRYDYNGRSRPFEDQHGLFTAATDVILRW